MNSIKHLVITGPECSGKSGLSEALASEYNTILVPEYARTYLTMLGRPYLIEDLDNIALGQLSLEEEARMSDKPFSVCDTDLTVLYIWSAYKYGEVSNLIEEGLYSHLDNKFYLLCYPDLTWEPDPLRENPENRIELFKLYEKLLKDLDVPFKVLKGNMKERLSICNQLLKEKGLIP